MDKIRFGFKTHFLHRLPIYIVVGLALPSLIIYAIANLTAPSAAETFAIFLDGNFKDGEGFASFVKDRLPSSIKKLDLYNHSSSMPTFSTIYAAQGMECDLLILSKEGAVKTMVADFCELGAENPYYASSNYQVEGKHFGIEIFNGTDGKLSEYVQYLSGTEYYAFINKSSVHNKGFRAEAETSYVSDLLEGIFHG